MVNWLKCQISPLVKYRPKKIVTGAFHKNNLTNDVEKENKRREKIIISVYIIYFQIVLNTSYLYKNDNSSIR